MMTYEPVSREPYEYIWRPDQGIRDGLQPLTVTLVDARIEIALAEASTIGGTDGRNMGKDLSRPGTRAGTTERDLVVERLAEAFGSGHLTREECDERTLAALQATFISELDALIADLPGIEPAPRIRSRTRGALAWCHDSPDIWMAGTLFGCWVMILPTALLLALGSLGAGGVALIVLSITLGLYIVITTLMGAVRAAVRRKGDKPWK